MKTTDYTQLLRIAGTFEGILSAATCGNVTIDGVQNAERWAHAAVVYGLTVAGSRSDAAALRRFVDAGFVAAAGQTQGRSYRLTVRGWFTAAAWLGCDPEALRVLLKKVSSLQAASRITLPGDKQTRLCMTWGLIPCAGSWFSGLKTPAVRDRFRGEAAELEGRLVPLIALGWVCRYVSTSGRFWAVTITEAGRDALRDWPNAEIPHDMPGADNDGIYSVWTDGYAKGKALARTSPPDAVKNMIARLLPASTWQ